MNFIKNLFSKNSSNELLNEEVDIDYNLQRPGLIKYFFIASIRWIMSYWYITFPVIGVALLIGGTAGIQYIEGNSKPVWGSRVDNLPMTSQLQTVAKKMTASPSGEFSHYKIYISGPEIHINIGLQTPDVTNYEQAQEYIKSSYEYLISQLPQEQQQNVRMKYSVVGMVAGSQPDKTTTNLHATKTKESDKFIFYHG